MVVAGCLLSPGVSRWSPTSVARCWSRPGDAADSRGSCRTAWPPWRRPFRHPRPREDGFVTVNDAPAIASQLARYLVYGTDGLPTKKGRSPALAALAILLRRALFNVLPRAGALLSAKEGYDKPHKIERCYRTADTGVTN